MKMEDKPLKESINKQYSKYGSLRMKDKESKIELCNAEDPSKFLTRIDSSIKDAKARVKQSIDNSTIGEEYYDSCCEPTNSEQDTTCIPMVKIDKNKLRTTSTTPETQ